MPLDQHQQEHRTTGPGIPPADHFEVIDVWKNARGTVAAGSMCQRVFNGVLRRVSTFMLRSRFHSFGKESYVECHST